MGRVMPTTPTAKDLRRKRLQLFEGEPVFGVCAAYINVGTGVVDNAHACVFTITQQFRIKFRNTYEACQKIVAASPLLTPYARLFMSSPHPSDAESTA